MKAKKNIFDFRLVFSVVTIFLIVLSLPIDSIAKESDELQIHVIDVSTGTGDAMVLYQPGSCSILIDAGQLVYANRVINKLNELSIRTLDMVIISHPHADHFGGLFDILPEFSATKFFDNGYEMEGTTLFDEYKKLRDLQPYSTLTYGDNVHCGKVKISVLHSASPQTTVASTNDTSLVLMISYEDFRLIHMADLGHDGENKLMEVSHDLKANIIKIGHHGFKDATSKALLTRVSPDYAVISSSGRCSAIFGCQPDESVLNLLNDLGISYSRTDQNGDIVISVNKNGFNVTNVSNK
jgi:competence protein ComEC